MNYFRTPGTTEHRLLYPAVVLFLMMAVTTGAAPGAAPTDDEPGVQIIELQEGSNLVSLSVMPEDLAVASLLADIIEDVVMVKDVHGRVFVPRYGIKQVEHWKPSASYFVFMRRARELTIHGAAVELSDWLVEVEEGWSQVAFPGRDPMPAAEALADLPESVERVEDDEGRSFVRGGDSTLETLLPGRGYRIYASEATSFKYRAPEPEVPADVYHVPASIVDDCSVDVTTLLHTWFESVPDNAVLEFGNEKCYRIDGGLRLRDRFGLTFNGNGSTFRAFTEGSSQRANWQIWGGGDLIFRDMIAIGANPNAGLDNEAYVRRLEWQHGYRLRGVQGAVLDNVEAYDVYGDYVNLSHDDRVKFPGEPNRNIVVKNGRFERTGRYGFTITNAEDVVFEGNYFNDTRWSHINIELNGDQEFGRNILIEGNTFGAAKHYTIVSTGAGGRDRVGNIVVRGNVWDIHHLTNNPAITFSAPTRSRWSDFLIEDNTIKGRTGCVALRFRRVDGVVVRNNRLEAATNGGCGGEVALTFHDVNGANIENNVFARIAYPDRFWSEMFSFDELSENIVSSQNRFE